jgi:hypothetical protein
VDTEIDRIYSTYLLAEGEINSRFAELDKKNTSTKNSIKIKNEEYFRRPLLQDLDWDHAIHTCGLKSYPEYLSENWKLNNWDSNVELNAEQHDILSRAFEDLSWDLSLFEKAVENAKGLWIEYLFEYQRINKLSSLNSSGSLGDVLSAFNPNISQLVSDLAESKPLKKISKVYKNPAERYGGISISINMLDFLKPEDLPDGVYEELRRLQREQPAPEPEIEKMELWDRKSFIASYLLKKFAEKYYVCQHFDEVQCRLCGRNFLAQAEVSWLYILPPFYCSTCLRMSLDSSDDFYQRLNFTVDERKKNAITGVKVFFEVFGFIPPTNFQKRRAIHEYQQQGIEIELLTAALKVSALLPKRSLAEELFGSWLHLLNEAELLELTDRGRGGYRSIASDGHVCLSLGERTICEHLTKLGLVHNKEPMYPFDKELNPNGLLRGDFEISGAFVEFAGMMQIPAYAERMEAKQKLAKKKKIRWIKLETASQQELEKLVSFLDFDRN